MIELDWIFFWGSAAPFFQFSAPLRIFHLASCGRVSCWKQAPGVCVFCGMQYVPVFVSKCHEISDFYSSVLFKDRETADDDLGIQHGLALGAFEASGDGGRHVESRPWCILCELIHTVVHTIYIHA